MPTPYPTPVPQSPPHSGAAVVPSGGSTYDSSAGFTVDASAVGAFSGPHYIERQGLNIQYTRVGSRGPENTAASSFSLSAQSHAYQVGSTELAITYQAYTTREKSYDNYATSSFYQPQKFSLFPNTMDSHGNIYNTPVGYQLCVQGHIDTTQFYERRELWDDANSDHTVSSNYSEGTNYAGAAWNGGSEADGWLWAGYGAASLDDRNRLMGAVWSNPEEKHSYQLGDNTGSEGTSIRYMWQTAWIGGPYQTNAEFSGIQNIMGTVDEVGRKISLSNGLGTAVNGVFGNCQYFMPPGQMTDDRNGSPTLPSWQHYIGTERYYAPPLLHYDWTQHYWA